MHCIDKTLSLEKYIGIRIGFRRNLSTPIKTVRCMFPILKSTVHYCVHYIIYVYTFKYVYKNDIGSYGILSERATDMKIKFLIRSV